MLWRGEHHNILYIGSPATLVNVKANFQFSVLEISKLNICTWMKLLFYRVRLYTYGWFFPVTTLLRCLVTFWGVLFWLFSRRFRLDGRNLYLKHWPTIIKESTCHKHEIFVDGPYIIVGAYKYKFFKFKISVI